MFNPIINGKELFSNAYSLITIIILSQEICIPKDGLNIIGKLFGPSLNSYINICIYYPAICFNVSISLL